MQNLKKQSKQGFSLIELLLVLGIIAALAIAAFMIYPKVSSSNKAQTEASNINTIKAAVNSLYTSAPDFKDLKTDVALKAKVFPDTMVSPGKTNEAINTFKGKVTVDASGEAPSGQPDSSFTITYEGVPPTECVKLVSAVASNFYKIRVGEGESGGTTVKDGGAADGGLKIAALSGACSAAKNTIAFVSL